MIKIRDLNNVEACDVVTGFLVLTGKLHKFPEMSLLFYSEHKDEVVSYMDDKNTESLLQSERVSSALHKYISWKLAEEITHKDAFCTFFTQRVDNTYIQIHGDTQTVLISQGPVELLYFTKYDYYLPIGDDFIQFVSYIESLSLDGSSQHFVVPVGYYVNVLDALCVKSKLTDIDINNEDFVFKYTKGDTTFKSNIPCVDYAYNKLKEMF